ncbi:MAG: hypothetical protein K2X81_28110 [Candidatus Obscuribacterales bacterium]|nr:hypothetical protein [Candidatus Obscuribacterales bacterium]
MNTIKQKQQTLGLLLMTAFLANSLTPVWSQVQDLSSTPSNAPAALNTAPSESLVPSTATSELLTPTGSGNTANTALKIGAASEKVPAGTNLRISFNNHFDSRVTQPGEPFSATLQEDFYSKSKVNPEDIAERRIILPEGTLIRGRVGQVKKPFLFSRGGSITLKFDHVVLPSGELLPLELELSTANTIVNQKGALYSDPGIGKKVSNGVKDGIGTFDKIRDAGVNAGKGALGGVGMLVTVPVAIAGGAVAGSAVTGGKAVVAVVGRGDSLIINPGDSVTIDFGGSFNLPSD